MNRLCTLVLAVLLGVSAGSSQQTSWQWVNPLPQGNLLNGIWAVSPDTVLTIGMLGTIVRTTNGGTTWQVQQTVAGISEQLFAIQFLTPSTGWAVGELGRVVRTLDAGASWTSIDAPTQKDLYAVNFVSATTGWVGGTGGVIFKTTNNGSSWTAESSGTKSAIYSISFASATTGWAVGASGMILKTTNAGATWFGQTSGTSQSLYSTEFLSTSVGWVSGAFGTVLRTVNGGTSWTTQTTSSIFSLYSIQFADFLTGWAVGAYGEIIKSTNGGINWFVQPGPTYNDLFGTSFVTANVGWAAGDLGTILKTTNGGLSWISQSNGNKNNLIGMHFPTTNTGFSVGEQGTIVKTTDAGLSWSSQSSGTLQTLYSTYFMNTLTGWAVGDSAVILKTTNGGANWLEEHSHTDPSLYSVFFVNSTNGWTVGDFGTILATQNGGLTWVPETSNTFTTLLWVRFSDPLNGWTVGYGGTILKTTNGGHTWNPQVSGTTRTLYAIEALSSSNLYVSGDFGTVLHTTNGGTTWTTQLTGADASFYGITFFSPSRGWAVGDDGAIYATVNGGTTWQSQQSGTDHTLWAAQAVPGSTGGIVYAAGIGGTILCAGVSPLPVRTWNGSFDSLWNTAANWTPIGIPEKIDSIIIPVTATSPVIRATAQEINISSLRIKSGAKLTVRNGLTQFVIKDDIMLDGTLAVDANANTEIVCGGTFFRGPGSAFTQGGSTVVFNGTGQLSGNFNRLTIRESANMQSVGNITVASNMIVMSTLNFRQFDTLFLPNPDPQALQGPGIITSGSIRRKIQPGSTNFYRFESPASYLKFYPGGTLPDSVIMTAFPHTLPPGLPDTLFARRYYALAAKGGSNYHALMSLRYDTSETAISIDNLSIFSDSSGVLKNLGSTDFLDSDIVAISLDSVKKFTTMYLGRSDYFPTHPLEFVDSLFVMDNGGIRDTLLYGALSGATDSIDPAYGETALGPKPPSGHDVRWVIPPTNGSMTNIHDIISAAHLLNTYTFSVRPGPGGYPFTLQWNVAMFPAGSFFLRDSATHGGQININMKLQSSYTLTNSSISRLEIAHIAPHYYTFTNGWNMVSLPLTTTTDGAPNHLFPTAVSNVFGYNIGYYVESVVKNGKGYWAKFGSPQQIPLDGFERTRDTIIIASGWNMIGSVSSPVSIQSIIRIPPGVVGQTFFGYSGSYFVTDSIRPSRGYWVKATSSGQLVISSSEALPAQAPKVESPAAALREFNMLKIADRSGMSQTLYFGHPADRSFSADEYELPPVPPPGSFDARFTSGAMVAVGTGDRPSYVIQLQASSYPLTFRWTFREAGLSGIILRDAETGNVIATSSGSGSGMLKLTDASVTSVRVEPIVSAALPSEFALRQNYPNPFNPTTTIAFDLPVAARVSIKVFNMLGQEVQLLSREEDLPAGTHAVKIDASNLASGVYFYQLSASGADKKEFHQVRKMMLIK